VDVRMIIESTSNDCVFSCNLPLAGPPTLSRLSKTPKNGQLIYFS
jgi:hypothetical protein